MIFANHAHVFPAESKPQGTLDKLKELMYACSIDKAVAFGVFKNQLPDTFSLKNHNAWLHGELRGERDIVGFGTVDFDDPDLEGQVDAIADYGFPGIKLHHAYQKIKVNGEAAYRVYRRADELGLFLSFHTGLHWHRLRDYDMLAFDDVAYDFPTLAFSMEHVGGYSFFREALAVMVNNSRRTKPQVYAGLTSVEDCADAHSGTWSLSDIEIENIILQTGEERTIFGLDFPYNGIDYTKRAVERIRSLNITESAKQAILAGNLARALGISLSAV